MPGSTGPEGAAIAPAWDAIKCSLTFCCNRGDYFSVLQDNLDSLRQEKQQLQDLKERLDKQVKEEVNKNPRFREALLVSSWHSRVTTMQNSVEDVIREGEEEVQKKCQRWLCPKHFCAFNEVGIRVSRKLADLRELIQSGNFDSVVEMQPPSAVDEWPMNMQTPVGFEDNMDTLWKYIQDSSSRIVGIYGPGGVGKTTLLKMTNNKLRSTKHDFDVVIRAVVSKDDSMSNIQEAIYRKLEIPEERWRDRSEEDRANQILKLLRTKKFVLLLDDLQENSYFIQKGGDLWQVGVPLDGNRNGSKVIFTTRSEEVCARIGAEKIIKVEYLPEKEALRLFHLCVGEVTLSGHERIPGIAEALAKKCHGLPLALVTVGRAMALSTDYKHWERVIEQLEEGHLSKLPEVEVGVFPLLKVCYDNMSNDALKECFLYFSMLPKVHNINKDELIELWIAEGFFGESCNMHEARIRGEDTIRSFKRSCLLDIGKSAEFVSMHDVIHTMTLWLANQGKMERKVLIRAYEIDMGKWKYAERIVLCGANIEFEELPPIPLCPQLKTLHIKGTKLKKFPDGFFKCMPVLRVLNLSDNADLAELPISIAELRNLQYLNVSRTSITELPPEIMTLTSLKILLEDKSLRRPKFPKNLILKLSSLQVFSMFPVWGFIDDFTPSYEDEAGFIQELKSLKYIKEVSLSLSYTKSIKTLLSSTKLQKCIKKLMLLEEAAYRTNPVSLVVHKFESLERLYIWPQSLWHTRSTSKYKDVFEGPVPRYIPAETYFHNLRFVHMVECAVKNASWLIYAPQLECLRLQDCHEMVEVVGDKFVSTKPVNLFSNLRELSLRHLPNLECIYNKALPFPCLEKLVVRGCLKLRRLPFNAGSAKNLKELVASTKWWKSLIWEPESPIYDPHSEFLEEDPQSPFHQSWKILPSP